ncbi:MAG TPA: hypothetical protein VMA35_09205 [Candidatus Sulfopaludibacter sp.]|nr:hypothetical protein [Candidatus Sulfopaludibacter sp.]
MSWKQLLKPRVETAAALIGTAFSAMLLVLTAMNAGPLWRDEVNTLNLAQMPSLKDLWHNMPFESFPLLWPLFLRVCGFLGMAGSDAGIRVLGLCVGLAFLASLWFCSRCTGGRAPILSIALLGTLPAFIFIVGANRAYGLAGCLLVVSFGMIWRVLESPTKSRVLWAGLVGLLFAQCVYFDALFLCAMLAGGALVAIRRRRWPALWSLAGIGIVCGASVTLYLPIIRQGSIYLPMIRIPFFNFSIIWNGFCDTLAGRSSADPFGPGGPQIWLWIDSLLVGSIVAVAMQWRRGHQTQNPGTGAAGADLARLDLALFCVVGMLFGIAGCFAFLATLHSFMEPWYYLELLALCAVSLDGILGANWPELRPWGWLRVGVLAVMILISTRPAWEEAHVRRSNLDLIAAWLAQKASATDLIVIEDAWEGITFNRYYHGPTPWLTVPPVASHEVHRNDLLMEKMSQPDAMSSLLREITSTLRNGKSVWLVTSTPPVRPKESPPKPTPPAPPPSEMPTRWWVGAYFYWWNRQVATLLLEQALNEQTQTIPVPGPVNAYEKVSVMRFSGYKPDPERLR